MLISNEELKYRRGNTEILKFYRLMHKTTIVNNNADSFDIIQWRLPNGLLLSYNNRTDVMVVRTGYCRFKSLFIPFNPREYIKIIANLTDCYSKRILIECFESLIGQIYQVKTSSAMCILL